MNDDLIPRDPRQVAIAELSESAYALTVSIAALPVKNKKACRLARRFLRETQEGLDELDESVPQLARLRNFTLYNDAASIAFLLDVALREIPTHPARQTFEDAASRFEKAMADAVKAGVAEPPEQATTNQTKESRWGTAALSEGPPRLLGD